MRLVSSLSDRDLKPIFSIVDTRLYVCFHQRRLTLISVFIL